MHTWAAWKSYLFGTPQKVTRWVIVVGVIIVVCNPGILTTAVNNLVIEINGIVKAMTPMIALLIVFAVGKQFIKNGFKIK